MRRNNVEMSPGESRAPYHYLHTNARREVDIRKYSRRERESLMPLCSFRTQHLRHSQQAPASRGNNTTYSRRVFIRQMLTALPECFQGGVYMLLIKCAQRRFHCSIQKGQKVLNVCFCKICFRMAPHISNPIHFCFVYIFDLDCKMPLNKLQCIANDYRAKM